MGKDWFPWSRYGRIGKHTPIPGEALGTFECHSCEAVLTPESDPEADCPGRNKRNPSKTSNSCPLTYSKTQ